VGMGQAVMGRVVMGQAVMGRVVIGRAAKSWVAMGRVGTGRVRKSQVGTGRAGTGRSQKKLQRTLLLLTGLGSFPSVVPIIFFSFLYRDMMLFPFCLYFSSFLYRDMMFYVFVPLLFFIVVQGHDVFHFFGPQYIYEQHRLFIMLAKFGNHEQRRTVHYVRLIWFFLSFFPSVICVPIFFHFCTGRLCFYFHFYRFPF
jgi:hypothetical protein